MKVIRVETCADCPYCENQAPDGCGVLFLCAESKWRPILVADTPDEFEKRNGQTPPDWCPLEDAQEERDL